MEITFGALAEPLQKQLEKYNIKLKNINEYQKAQNSISMLYLHGYLTDGEKKKVYQRLMKDFERDIKKSLEEK